MKDVLLLHDNARPHTNLSTCEAIANMRWTVLPHPAHGQDLSPSDCRLFGPVKDALHGRHFADDIDLKQSFRDILVVSRGRESYVGSERLIQHWQKCIENNEDSVGKWLHISKRFCESSRWISVWLQLHFLRKNWRLYFRTASLIHLQVHTALRHRKPLSKSSRLWERKMSYIKGTVSSL
jgi:hypothetical protein